ncbi:hypothetical protein HDU76_006000 [Blyttiomyces sp. JEL0837]|nr:hypothetical protein HDU76_006000 [Blyttiomyces sp. JEL0837]
MFFSNNLFPLNRRNDSTGMAVLWVAATVGTSTASIKATSTTGGLKKLSKKEVNSVNVEKACNYLSNPPEPMALRLSSNLMVGAARVLGNQYSFLYSDVNQVFLRLKKAFSEASLGAEISMAVSEANFAAITLAENSGTLFPEEAFRFSSTATNANDNDSNWVMGTATSLELSSAHGGSLPAFTVANSTSDGASININAVPRRDVKGKGRNISAHTLSNADLSLPNIPLSGAGVAGVSGIGTPVFDQFNQTNTNMFDFDLEAAADFNFDDAVNDFGAGVDLTSGAAGPSGTGVNYPSARDSDLYKRVNEDHIRDEKDGKLRKIGAGDSNDFFNLDFDRDLNDQHQQNDGVGASASVNDFNLNMDFGGDLGLEQEVPGGDGNAGDKSVDDGTVASLGLKATRVKPVGQHGGAGGVAGHEEGHKRKRVKRVMFDNETMLSNQEMSSLRVNMEASLKEAELQNLEKERNLRVKAILAENLQKPNVVTTRDLLQLFPTVSTVIAYTTKSNNNKRKPDFLDADPDAPLSTKSKPASKKIDVKGKGRAVALDDEIPNRDPFNFGGGDLERDVGNLMGAINQFSGNNMDMDFDMQFNDFGADQDGGAGGGAAAGPSGIGGKRAGGGSEQFSVDLEVPRAGAAIGDVESNLNSSVKGAGGSASVHLQRRGGRADVDGDLAGSGVLPWKSFTMSASKGSVQGVGQELDLGSDMGGYGRGLSPVPHVAASVSASFSYSANNDLGGLPDTGDNMYDSVDVTGALMFKETNYDVREESQEFLKYVIHLASTVDNREVSLDTIVGIEEGKPTNQYRSAKAQAFYQILSLTNSGHVKPRQSEAYATIYVTVL